MEQLVQGLRSAFHERVAGVSDIRATTQGKLAELGVARGAAAAEEQQQRDAYVDELRQEVNTLRLAAQSFLAVVGVTQDAVSTAQREQLEQHTQALHQDVEALRQAAQDFLQEVGRHSRSWRRISARPSPQVGPTFR
jgi:ABC-type transport system involved in cytochrome bd biosynthesis fused ATPase/permease subunit